MASAEIHTMSIVLGFFLSYLALGAATNDAAQEKASDSVVVVGKVFCDVCLEGKPSENGYVISGAPIAVECNLNRKAMTVSITGETDGNGEFKVELPSSIFPFVDQLSSKCSVRARNSPYDSCRIPSNSAPSKLTLHSTSNGVLTYSAGSFSYRHESLPPSCYRKDILKIMRGRLIAENVDQFWKAGLQTSTNDNSYASEPSPQSTTPGFAPFPQPNTPGIAPFPQPSTPDFPPFPQPITPGLPPFPKCPPGSPFAWPPHHNFPPGPPFVWPPHHKFPPFPFPRPGTPGFPPFPPGTPFPKFPFPFPFPPGTPFPQFPFPPGTPFPQFPFPPGTPFPKFPFPPLPPGTPFPKFPFPPFPPGAPFPKFPFPPPGTPGFPNIPPGPPFNFPPFPKIPPGPGTPGLPPFSAPQPSTPGFPPLPANAPSTTPPPLPANAPFGSAPPFAISPAPF